MYADHLHKFWRITTRNFESSDRIFKRLYLIRGLLVSAFNSIAWYATYQNNLTAYYPYTAYSLASYLSWGKDRLFQSELGRCAGEIAVNIISSIAFELIRQSYGNPVLDGTAAKDMDGVNHWDGHLFNLAFSLIYAADLCLKYRMLSPHYDRAKLDVDMLTRELNSKRVQQKQTHEHYLALPDDAVRVDVAEIAIISAIKQFAEEHKNEILTFTIFPDPTIVDPSQYIPGGTRAFVPAEYTRIEAHSTMSKIVSVTDADMNSGNVGEEIRVSAPNELRAWELKSKPNWKLINRQVLHNTSM